MGTGGRFFVETDIVRFLQTSRRSLPQLPVPEHAVLLLSLQATALGRRAGIRFVRQGTADKFPEKEIKKKKS
jgi:hypothetical protein